VRNTLDKMVDKILMFDVPDLRLVILISQALAEA